MLIINGEILKQKVQIFNFRRYIRPRKIWRTECDRARKNNYLFVRKKNEKFMDGNFPHEVHD